MGYYTETMFGCQCDKCGELYYDYVSGEMLWVDKDTARENACDKGEWLEDYDNDKIYCPKCAKIDDNDNLVVL